MKARSPMPPVTEHPLQPASSHGPAELTRLLLRGAGAIVLALLLAALVNYVLAHS